MVITGKKSGECLQDHWSSGWIMKHIKSRSLLLNDVQNSRMCLKTNFMQNYFSNTTKTSFVSSFLLNTCYFVVSYFNGK